MQKEELTKGALVCVYADGKPFINTTILAYNGSDKILLDGFIDPHPIKDLRPAYKGYKNCDDLRTSQEWHKEEFAMYKILDPDGWDRSNYEYSWFIERISREEFERRLSASTIQPLQLFKK